MTVRLIAITQPIIDDCSTPSELLAYCARVSSTANQLKHETGPNLIRSLLRRKEWSPLEMISLTMEIVTTRDIARQILRHRSFSFQEFSQRYSKVTEPFVSRETRLQHPTDRQMSIACDDLDLSDRWHRVQNDVANVVANGYQWALDNGIAKEQARAILPEGMTPSRLYMAGTLRSWVHYCDLRCTQGTQKEHRQIAEQAWAIVCAQIPLMEGVSA